jgi:HSP20 family protein
MNNIACNNTKCAPSHWTGFQELESQLDRIFHGNTTPDRNTTGTWAPAVDIYETSDAYVIHADLPGVTKEDIGIQVLEDQVAIRGSRKRLYPTEEKGYRRYERGEGRFERNFRIKGGIDTGKVDARFENGVLTLTLPKPEEAKPRHIEIKIN